MKNQRTLEELVREVLLSTPPAFQQIGEIKDTNQLNMFVDAQSNTFGSYTTMTTDMNRFNRVLDDLITMRDKEVEEAIKTAMSISHRSIVHILPPNYFNPTIKVIFYDPFNSELDRKYYKEKNK